MLGAEFIRHGPQQSATLIVVDNRFPGVAEIKEDRCTLHEEWYTFKDFALDMHVLLAQVTQGMKGVDYRRANYPNTWARLEGKGRVYYTGMGHREDVWTNPMYQKLLLGAIGWAAGNVTADVTPNLEKATPGHREIQPREDPNAAPKKAKK
jgi:type 1 glutamine amidotransferase